MNKPADIAFFREQIQEILRDSARPSYPVVLAIMFSMTDNEPPTIMHLGPDGSDRAACGMETNIDHVGAEHNDITCPLCFAIHEAECAKGDDESGYFEWDVDSILETDAFMDDCVRSIMHRLAFKGK